MQMHLCTHTHLEQSWEVIKEQNFLLFGENDRKSLETEKFCQVDRPSVEG